MSDVIARACSNVALVKYWGKRSGDLNLPYTGSISVTLGGLWTTASLTLLGRGGADRIVSGDTDLSQRPEMVSFLATVRSLCPQAPPVAISLESNFPVAAGLASSASTFAALARALSAAFALNLSERELTILARRGSGSAARSIHGGFVEWFAGERSDGSDCFAEPLIGAADWPIGIVVAITDTGPKRVASRAGMQHVAATSPFFPAWLDSHEADLQAMRAAVGARDLAAAGTIAEHNCLKMHAVSIAARPGLIYWNPITLAVIDRVRTLRDDGIAAYFTIDAGPQVKILCAPDDRALVAEQIGRVDGVRRTLLSQPGPGVELLEAR